MPTTLHLRAEIPADLAHAAELLRTGHTVAFATETVYGLGANALDPTAVARIFAAKQRPAWDPLIVHLADAGQLPEITTLSPDLQARTALLADAFWPGPLTLLLPRNARIPDAVTSGRPLVGVRVPAHDAARELLRLAAIPVAAPSANRFGHTSPTTAAHVLADLNGRIDAVLDAGPTTIGLESTVFDPATSTLYRPGAITAELLAAVLNRPITTYQPPAQHEPAAALPSPGAGIRHYAPRARLILTGPTPEALTAALEALPRTERPGILQPETWPVPPDTLTYPWGPWHQPETLAANLFAGLRALDDQGTTTILAPLPPPGAFREAIRDRLQKAARSKKQ